MITSKMTQQIWAVIESTQVSALLQFDDSALVQLLLNRFEGEQYLDPQTVSSLDSYLQSKLPLIRDIAEAKLEVRQGCRW